MFRENKFYLMNKDAKIAMFESTRNEFKEVQFQTIEQYGKLPIGINNIQTWIENRKAPKHRAHIEELLRSIGCYDLDGYIRITHALNLNDTFWVKPVESSLSWDNVSLFRNDFDETIAHIAFEGGLYGEQFTTTSPEFGTDGTFAKCWIRDADNGIYLLKRGSSGARNTGLEPYSEMYTSQLAEIVCPDSVKYEVVQYRGQVASKCPLFTSEKEGFAPLYRCLDANSGIKKMLEYYTSIGSEDAFRRMLVLDALSLNTDRHKGNFGIIFDTDTMEPIRMAPIFDNNQALLPYAEDADFKKENIGRYLAERPVKIGNDFNEVAHSVLTPEIASDLKNLKGFKFDRDTNYALPEKRLQHLEEIIDMQIDNILHDRHLYISADIQKTGSYTEKYRERAIAQNKGFQLRGKDELEL
jgi:hypothetical protein